MVKIDLITGFLGSGKTTFIRKYAQYLMDAGNNIGILENDYGAVNVDMMLLQDLMGENCELEMISGGCDKDCHTKHRITFICFYYFSSRRINFCNLFSLRSSIPVVSCYI